MRDRTNLHKYARLWKVTDIKNNTFYLLGSCHKNHPDFLDVSDNILNVVNKVQSVYGELDLTELGWESMVDRLLIISNKNESYLSFLDAEALQELHSILQKTKFSPYIEKIKTLDLRTFFYLMVVAEINYFEERGDSMDIYLLKKAQGLNKKVGGLESISNRVALFDHLGNTKMVIKLQNTPKEIRKSEASQIFDIENFLFSLDPFLERYLNEKMEIEPGDEQSIIGQIRNIRDETMFNKMIEIMQKESALFVVGFSHLQNILKFAKESGFTLTPIESIKENVHRRTLQRQIKPLALGLSLVLFSFLLLGNARKSSVLNIGFAASSLASGLFILKKVWNRTHFIFYKPSLPNFRVIANALSANKERGKPRLNER